MIQLMNTELVIYIFNIFNYITMTQGYCTVNYQIIYWHAMINTIFNHTDLSS